ncbi:hypothetical protein RB2501_01530 [Robiginitalea biformata HTCC2501]|uniref:Uncharacterized protein n=1 Tax=Robiginitalea biformata (strain ATCC BAA-864 / DSM 15991 / KCTC 12146 / HTCC2501) TaxID=313596 RepID=A4CPY1_ROBBH|nr:hypothetical protein RB2501_01530 [Robiginitalea biformata HTCC2501]
MWSMLVPASGGFPRVPVLFWIRPGGAATWIGPVF